jgi:MFS family permease
MSEAGTAGAEAESSPTAGIWSTFGQAPAAVRTVLFGVLLNRLSGSLNVFLVLYLTSLGYSSSQAVTGLAVYGGGGIAGSLLGGTLVDRLGSRPVIVLSMGGTGVFTVALLFLHGYGSILTTVTLAGLCAQMFRPASSALLSERTSAHSQVMIFAIYRFAINVGVMAAPLVGYGLINLDHQKYDFVFWGQALIAVIFAAAAWRALSAGPPGAPATSETPARTGPRGGYLALRRDRRYLLFLLAAFIYSAVYVQYLSTLPLMVHSAGLDMIWYTAAVSLNAFIVIAFELLMTKVTQRWPKHLSLGLGMVLLGAGMVVYGLSPLPVIIIAGTALWSLGEIFSGPTFFSYPAVVGGNQKGRYIGSFQFMVGAGTALGPVAGGWLYVRLGQTAWPVLGISALVAAVAVVAAVRRSRTG